MSHPIVTYQEALKAERAKTPRHHETIADLTTRLQAELDKLERDVHSDLARSTPTRPGGPVTQEQINTETARRIAALQPTPEPAK